MNGSVVFGMNLLISHLFRKSICLNTFCKLEHSEEWRLGKS